MGLRAPGKTPIQQGWHEPAAFFNKTDAGGVLRMNVKLRSCGHAVQEGSTAVRQTPAAELPSRLLCSLRSCSRAAPAGPTDLVHCNLDWNDLACHLGGSCVVLLAECHNVHTLQTRDNQRERQASAQGLCFQGCCLQLPDYLKAASVVPLPERLDRAHAHSLPAPHLTLLPRAGPTGGAGLACITSKGGCCLSQAAKLGPLLWASTCGP